MRFFRKLKKIQEENIVEGSLLEIETNKQETDFTDTMFTDIAKMKLKIENIKSEEEIYIELKALLEDFEIYIQKANELMEDRQIEDKLNSIRESNIILKLDQNPQILESLDSKRDRVEQELTIEDYYRNIKAVYNVKYKRAMQTIYMKKVEKFNADMDKALLGENNKPICYAEIQDIVY